MRFGRPIPTPTLEEFIACCQAECGFLVREYGFVRLASPGEYNQYSVRFKKGAYEVEVYGENYGAAASCDLVRGKDRLYLGLMVPVEQRGGGGRKGARLGQLDQVRRIAAILKLHASDFLSGDSSRFYSALAEWRRVTRPRKISEAQRLDRLRLSAVTEAGHASKREDHAKVVRLLEPYATVLSPRQRRMLEVARDKLKNKG